MALHCMPVSVNMKLEISTRIIFTDIGGRKHAKEIVCFAACDGCTDLRMRTGSKRGRHARGRRCLRDLDRKGIARSGTSDRRQAIGLRRCPQGFLSADKGY